MERGGEDRKRPPVVTVSRVRTFFRSPFCKRCSHSPSFFPLLAPHYPSLPFRSLHLISHSVSFLPRCPFLPVSLSPRLAHHYVLGAGVDVVHLLPSATPRSTVIFHPSATQKMEACVCVRESCGGNSGPAWSVGIVWNII